LVCPGNAPRRIKTLTKQARNVKIHDAGLLTLKDRLSFFQKCRDAFGLVFGREAKGKEIHLAAKAFVEIRLRRELHGLFR